MTDIATRVYNHTFKIDPIVRSVIDTDFYKLLMAQSILHHNPDTQVTFSVINGYIGPNPNRKGPKCIWILQTKDGIKVLTPPDVAPSRRSDGEAVPARG